MTPEDGGEGERGRWRRTGEEEGVLRGEPDRKGSGQAHGDWMSVALRRRLLWRRGDLVTGNMSCKCHFILAIIIS